MGRGGSSANTASAALRAGRSSDRLHEQISAGGPIARILTLDQTNRPVDWFVRLLDRGELNDSPSYQRGAVWNVERQRNLVKSLVMGLPIGAIFINNRGSEHAYTLVDGKQRVHAVRAFFNDELTVPGSWFPPDYKKNPGEQGEITFSQFTDRGRRGIELNASVATYETHLTGPDVEDQEAALFDLINFGGVAQGERDENAPERYTQPDCPFLVGDVIRQLRTNGPDKIVRRVEADEITVEALSSGRVTKIVRGRWKRYGVAGYNPAG